MSDYASPAPAPRDRRRLPRRGLVVVLAVTVTAAAGIAVPALAAAGNGGDGGPGGRAGDGDGRSLSLIHLADTHGKFVPHWEKADAPGSDGAWHPDMGGFARTYTLVQRLRQQTAGRNLFLVSGDNFHGSGELLFTKGRAAVPIMNSFAPDAYSPGNWDYAEGAVETRARFTGIPAGPQATPGGRPLVSFPVIGAGVYNGDDAPAYATPGTRLFAPYLIKQVNGVKVAILGLNDDKPSDQAATFTIGLRLRAGFDEAPALVREVRAKGAEVVVAMSEAGLAQNVALARDVPGIDVVLSGDTHEETYRPIRIPHGEHRSTLVVESGEGGHVGQLDLRVIGRGSAARVVQAAWKLREVDAGVPEDPGMKAMVDAIRKPFLSGPDFVNHTRAYPGGGAPMVLNRPLDQVIGTTDVDLQRHSVIPTAGDELIAEAIRSLTGAQIAGTNGFRYDIPIPAGQPITVGDVYAWLPIGAHVSVGTVTGSQLRDRFEKYLGAVLDPNPYRRTGGWLPVLSGARFFFDATGPHGPGQDRIVRAEVYNAATGKWDPLQDDRTYTLAGCYSPGDALDRMCRMNGVRDMRFLVAGPGGSLTGALSTQPPLLAEMLPAYRTTRRAAPDGVVAAPEALLRYLIEHGGARAAALAPYLGPTWHIVSGALPAPSPLAPDAVQPLQGIGPDWLAALRVG